jgi:transcription-repair coupling factor (superfamily II helicase)
MDKKAISLLSEVNNNAIGFALSRFVVSNKGTYVCFVDSISFAEFLYKQIRYFIPLLQGDNAQKKGAKALLLKDRETLPYDTVSPPAELVSQRLKTLAEWKYCDNGILIVAVSTAMHRLPPVSFISRSQLSLKKGQSYGYDALLGQLISAGYERVGQVSEAGQYSQRGGVVDVFMMGTQISLPLRIEFFDDEIEEIRCFDPNSQRSIESLPEVNLAVANEYTLQQETQDYFCEQFEYFFPNQSYHKIYQSIAAGDKFEGIEYFLPLLHQQELASILDYCPEGTQCLLTPKVKKSANEFYRECQRVYEKISDGDEHLSLPVNEIFFRFDELIGGFEQKISLQSALSSEQHSEVAGLVSLPVFISEEIDFQEKVKRLLSYAEKYHYHLVFSFISAVRTEMLGSYFVSLNLSWQDNITDLLKTQEEITIAIINSPLEKGFIDKKNKLLFCTESDIYGKVIPHKELTQETSPSVAVKNHLNYIDLPNLQLGQLVTHIEHGLGIFKGLQVMDVGGYKQDVVVIEYADNSTLYVPVDRLHYIERYIGNSESAFLDSLGGNSWGKRKEKAKQRIFDAAAELLEVYAKRNQVERSAIPIPEDYKRFVEEFPYIETPDQSKAIQEVLADLKLPKPMDRLICGDVGFGKTEVAMRASYAVVANGKQVAILVPTTLLANQHYQSFCERFANWAVRIGMVSRLQNNKKNQEVLAQVSNGEIDIIIGTHRLLQKDVGFKQLGLVVIDEEHRFGVRQKESFKTLRTEVDLISMTATPIPRTLNLTFSNLRDVSIIAEAPAGRLSVQTFVFEHSDNIVKEAILREIKRGGQVYFVHNSVATILRRRQEIIDLLPDVSIGVAHGQMPEKEMESVMEGFYVGNYQILLCTTIIEMGLDIPNANTILIDRADKFGLAQLHQLRGRVGRSSHQAYAYLFTPEMSILKTDAKKRLLAIQEAQQLGAGFRLALEDMEIRGVGEILGEEQQGHAQKIGLSLYLEILDEAIQSQNSENYQKTLEEKQKQKNCEVDLNTEAIFPQEYIDDVNVRLSLYQRLGVCDEKQLEELWFEVRDRFGRPLPAVENLFDLYRVRHLCLKVGIEELKATQKGLKLKLSAEHKLSIDKLLSQIQKNPTAWQLKKNNELFITKETVLKKEEESIGFVHFDTLIDKIS